jgi:hypothetical protein
MRRTPFFRKTLAFLQVRAACKLSDILAKSAVPINSLF